LDPAPSRTRCVSDRVLISRAASPRHGQGFDARPGLGYNLSPARSSRMRKVILTAILLALPALTACGGVRHNLTPELMTLENRPVDVDNTFSLTCNEDWRMLVSDWQRAA